MTANSPCVIRFSIGVSLTRVIQDDHLLKTWTNARFPWSPGLTLRMKTTISADKPASLGFPVGADGSTEVLVSSRVGVAEGRPDREKKRQSR
jgi:hypothetical protein